MKMIPISESLTQNGNGFRYNFRMQTVRRHLKSATLTSLAAMALALFSGCADADAKTFQMGTQESKQLIPAEAVSCPQPAISSDMLEQGIKANCLAKFAIAPTGKHTVQLLSSTGSSEVDELTLETLRTWRFLPASLGGEPVPSVRKIKVEFEVD